MKLTTALIIALTGIARPSFAALQIPMPPAAPQNPSPMVDHLHAMPELLERALKR